MKGILFTEFLEMVESRHGIEMVDRLIERSDLRSMGAYTSVGTYDYQELIRLVEQLSREISMPAPDLIRSFGLHLFSRFAVYYTKFFENIRSAPEFLSTIENHIHVEVRKLYPDAELPRFVCHEPAPGALEMTYSSRRPFGDLAEGLILGCIQHFGHPFALRRDDLPAIDGLNSIRFTLSPMEVSA